MRDEDQAPRNYVRVLDVLEIDEECVRSHLIDARGVEKVILIPLYDDARTVMYTTRPGNVWQCYTVRAEQLMYQAGARSFVGITRDSAKNVFENADDLLRVTKQSRDANHAALLNFERERSGGVGPLREMERQLQGCQV